MGKICAIFIFTLMFISLLSQGVYAQESAKCGFLCSLGKFFSGLFSTTGSAVQTPPPQNYSDDGYIRVSIKVKKG